MKKMSLIKKELLTDGAQGLAFVLMGIIHMLKPDTNFAVGVALALAIVGLGLVVLPIVLRKIGKFDIWDEAAREHYTIAQKRVLYIIQISLLLAGLVLLGAKMFGIIWSLTLNVSHLFIVYGILELLLSIIFIILEKREA